VSAGLADIEQGFSSKACGATVSWDQNTKSATRCCLIALNKFHIEEKISGGHARLPGVPPLRREGLAAIKGTWQYAQGSMIEEAKEAAVGDRTELFGPKISNNSA
jgi:hypothetical protein